MVVPPSAMVTPTIPSIDSSRMALVLLGYRFLRRRVYLSFLVVIMSNDLRVLFAASGCVGGTALGHGTGVHVVPRAGASSFMSGGSCTGL
jgi:hypothetical protein